MVSHAGKENGIHSFSAPGAKCQHTVSLQTLSQPAQIFLNFKMECRQRMLVTGALPTYSFWSLLFFLCRHWLFCVGLWNCEKANLFYRFTLVWVLGWSRTTEQNRTPHNTRYFCHGFTTFGSFPLLPRLLCFNGYSRKGCMGKIHRKKRNRNGSMSTLQEVGCHILQYKCNGNFLSQRNVI